VEIHRAESDESMKFISKQDSSKVIQGEFSLKNLGPGHRKDELPVADFYLR
jgi:hypothetical protein